MKNTLHECREMLRELVRQRGLDHANVVVRARPLTPEEAIGSPGRRDFPILEGKERVIEANVMGAHGQAFTDSASDFSGRLSDIMDLPLADNRSRALFVATMNATLRYLGLVKGVIHCKNNDPESCAAEIAAEARKTGAGTVGLVGMNPAIAEALVREFGAEGVRITDLNPQNIATRKFGVVVMDGRLHTRDLVRASDLILVTGTAIVNDTLDDIRSAAQEEGKRLIVFGITAAGVSYLAGLDRWCPKAQD